MRSGTRGNGAADVWPALRDTLMEVRILGSHLLRQSRLSVGQYFTLHWIEKAGDLRLSELAASFGISRPAATSLISSLEAQGWVHRMPSPEDRRGVVVRITPKSTALFARFDRECERLVRSSTRHLPRETCRDTVRTLRTVHDGMRSHREREQLELLRSHR